MYQKTYKLIREGLLIGVLFFFIFSCSEKRPLTSQDQKSLFLEPIRDYYILALDSATHYLSMMDSAADREINQQLFLESRKWYKRAEPIVIAFDHENYKTINAPNLLKIEAEDFTEIKKLNPRSYQVLEELLFLEEKLDKVSFQRTLTFLKARLPFMAYNNMIYNQSDRHHLKMIRDAIINIATKGITGFDSPALANSLQEAVYNYECIEQVIEIYSKAFNSKSLLDEWKLEIERTKADLLQSDFDSFDRYLFIKNHTNKQLSLLNQTSHDWNIALAKNRSLNPKSDNLFSKDFLNLSHFSPYKSPSISDDRISLGKALFDDPNLSKDGKLSCKSCHIKELAFTDGRKTSLGNNGKPLDRNSPALTYAAFQRRFFLDATASGLESQILGVINNTQEFHTDVAHLEASVKSDDEYKVEFEKLYDGKIDGATIRHAISTYIRSLAPFDSRFDKNMQGKEATLTEQEIEGFNLFMGKAACSTCHFAPVFNGTVPPKYDETELESLGVPENADFDHPILDQDEGAYWPYKVEERKGFFKTPSIRNIELTAPYMHNGVYNTLEEVMRFYNAGGGTGMKLDVPYQTLPSDSLGLNDQEIQAIIAFMKTLTDSNLIAF
ncbi:MAG: methylamine utilization protein [Cyclobacteriaceae bacterium]